MDKISSDQEDKLKRSLLFYHMPIYFNGLVVENTTCCNAKCAICYQSAGPHGSEMMGKAFLTVKELETVIREAAEIETLNKRFHLSGGESFLDIDSCVTLFEIAKDSGFLDITSTTNAHWAKNISKATMVCDRIRKSGLTTLEISWDYWHMQWNPPDAISNCLDACKKVGIEANLRVLTNKHHSIEEALSYLRSDSVELANRITCGPVFPTGRAAKDLDILDFYKSQCGIGSNCHSALNLTVNPVGNVYPCCAGFDQTNIYNFGNIKEKSIIDIAESMNRSSLLRSIVFNGISTLLPIIEKAGIHIDQNFNSICHMCWSIFSQPECVEALKSYFSEVQIQAFRMAIEYLENQQRESNNPNIQSSLT